MHKMHRWNPCRNNVFNLMWRHIIGSTLTNQIVPTKHNLSIIIIINNSRTEVLTPSFSKKIREKMEHSLLSHHHKDCFYRWGMNSWNALGRPSSSFCADTMEHGSTRVSTGLMKNIIACSPSMLFWIATNFKLWK